MEDKQKIPFYRLQEMVERGQITKQSAREMIQNGQAAGERRKEPSVKFGGTTMTTYYPPIAFRPSKAKGNEKSNVVTDEMLALQKEYDEKTRPIFNQLVNKYSG